MNKIEKKSGVISPLGVTVTGENRINVATILNTDKDCGIVLVNKKDNAETKVAFEKSDLCGNVYCMELCGVNLSQTNYYFYDGEDMISDPYAKVVYGNEKWGEKPNKLTYGIYEDQYDWEQDTPLYTPFKDTILYLCHVRGFTKHVSSGVKEKGRFGGITEKIPYLKDLGITAIELMPAYEFLEVEQEKLNYWGYKESFYYAPKSAYCHKDTNGQYYNSMKEMVHSLHKNGIEVILQFYFPDHVKKSLIIDVCKFWTKEYHIDGFHLMGNEIPTAILATEPGLQNSKLLYYDFPVGQIYGGKHIPQYKNLAACKNEFEIDCRRFLKSDEGLCGSMLHHFKDMADRMGTIHYITGSNGFTLHDLVSYERKHNEANGEKNMDGNPYNFSWNCGVEGKTTKKSINKLRMKQMKNGFALTVLSLGTPLLLAGDEFANSQDGNNNPYCIDSSVTWLNWNQLHKYEELHEYVKALIAFYKAHEMLHRDKPYTLVDVKECGYPDLSFHGEEPWKLQYDHLTRSFAILYCGQYVEKADADKSDVYIAFNMHWDQHEFVLPKLPKGKKWYSCMDTSEALSFVGEKELKDQKKIVLSDRSIVILIAK